jgi:hypothetical protein
VIDRVTRRQFVVRSVGVAVGASLLTRFHPSLVLAQPDVHGEDLRDAGEAFRRGVARGVAVVSGPDGLVLEAEQHDGGFTSAVLRSSMPFTHVGLHWSAAVPPRAEITFEVRTGVDESKWSPWSSVQVESLPEDTPEGDYFGNLIAADHAQLVQYRATFRTPGRANVSLRRVTATVIASPVATSTSSVLPTVAVADGDSGRVLLVVSRDQWGADESLRFDRRGRKIWPEMFVLPTTFVVHHTATRNDYASVAEAAAEVRAIYRYHAVTKGWGDIGYTHLVDKFGTVFEGRHGRGEGAGREVLSPGVVAGHDFHHNYGSVGVACLGDATKSDWPMPTAAGPMWDALVDTGVFEAGRHFIRPLRAGKSTQSSDADIATTDFLRSDNVWTNAVRNVSGHRESEATTCPGDSTMALLDDLRNAVHADLAGVSRSGIALSNTPAGRDTAVNSRITYTWSPEPPEAGWTLLAYEYCFEGWAKSTKSDDIQYLSGSTGGVQPRAAWTRVGTTTTTAAFTPTKAGHYTLHVRAVLKKDGAERRSAYAGTHTSLVK